MGNIIKITGMMSFPSLNEVDDNGKYSCCIIFKKEEVEKMKKEIMQIQKDNITKKLASPIKSGNEKIENENIKIREQGELEGKTAAVIAEEIKNNKYLGTMKDRFYFNAKSKFPVKTVNRAGAELKADEYSKYVFGGQEAIFAVNFYAYNFNGKNGIGVGLTGVQVLETGKKIAGSGGNSVTFDALPPLEQESPELSAETKEENIDDLIG